jgi:hypothetical protein
MVIQSVVVQSLIVKVGISFFTPSVSYNVHLLKQSGTTKSMFFWNVSELSFLHNQCINQLSIILKKTGSVNNGAVSIMTITEHVPRSLAGPWSASGAQPR